MAPPLQMRLVVKSLLALACAATAAMADPFAAPSPVPAAQDHYVRATKLFAAKQFADAAIEYAAAYELDPSSKFLLFDLGLARRMAGACNDALEAYQQFLDASPPRRLADKAQFGIDHCKAALAVVPKPEPPVLEPKPVEPTPPVIEPKAPAIEPPPRIVVVHDPWYRDRLGDGLLAGGGAAALTGGALYWLASRAADDTRHATTLQMYRDRKSDASTYQTASWIAAGASAALVVAAVVRYAIRPDATVAAIPTRGGATFALEVVF